MCRALDAASQSLVQVDFFPKQAAKGGVQGSDPFRAETCPPQADPIETSDRVGAVHNTEGRHVTAGPRQAPQQGQGSDPHKLVNHAVAGHKGTVRDLHIAGQERTPAMIVWLPIRQLWATWAFCIR